MDQRKHPLARPACNQSFEKGVPGLDHPQSEVCFSDLAGMLRPFVAEALRAPRRPSFSRRRSELAAGAIVRVLGPLGADSWCIEYQGMQAPGVQGSREEHAAPRHAGEVHAGGEFLNGKGGKGRQRPWPSAAGRSVNWC